MFSLQELGGLLAGASIVSGCSSKMLAGIGACSLAVCGPDVREIVWERVESGSERPLPLPAARASIVSKLNDASAPSRRRRPIDTRNLRSPWYVPRKRDQRSAGERRKASVLIENITLSSGF